MTNPIKALALSFMVGAGAAATVPATAQADSLYFHVDGRHHGPGFGMGFRDDDYGFRDEWRRDWRRDDWRRDRWRGCTPDRALDKAQRIGLHRVRIRDVSDDAIVVSGRDRGERVVVTFGRGRHCPILSY